MHENLARSLTHALTHPLTRALTSPRTGIRTQGRGRTRGNAQTEKSGRESAGGARLAIGKTGPHSIASRFVSLRSFRREGVARPASFGVGGRFRPALPSSNFSCTVSRMKDLEIADPVQRRLMLEDECILVNENDEAIGHDSKYNCHLMEKIEKENLLHRAFSVFLFNSKNELLLQQRSATKVTFPLVWTNSCCSHPLYRESELEEKDQLGVKRAAQRKLFDELGIKADELPLDQFDCLGRIHYKAASNGQWGEHEIDYILFFKGDVTVDPNPDEVANVKYMTQDQVKDLIQKADAKEDGIVLSPWFRLIVEKSLFPWWKALQSDSLAKVVDVKTIHRF